MRAKTPKQREWSESLLNRGVEFHGHGGPFMILGLRIGLTALKRLDAQGWFDLSCCVYLRWRLPDSCVIDGIQTSTGCTMGKHNIKVEEGDTISAEFTKEMRTLRIALRRAVKERVMATLGENEEEVKALISELIKASDYDLFEISSSI